MLTVFPIFRQIKKNWVEHSLSTLWKLRNGVCSRFSSIFVSNESTHPQGKDPSPKVRNPSPEAPGRHSTPAELQPIGFGQTTWH